MKTSITIRIDKDVLAAARQQTLLENRTMTNLIETSLKSGITETANAALTPGALLLRTKAL
jgi:hypothetical protein